MSGLTEAFAALSVELNGTAGALGKLPTAFNNATDAAQALDIATKQLAIDKQAATAAANALKTATDNSGAAMQKAAEDAAKLSTALEAVAEAQTQSATSTANGIQVAGQAKPVYLQVAAATDAQTASLVALLKAQNAYTDAVSNTLTVAKGWNDYLAGLADSYKQGSIDLIQYKRALE